MGPHRAPDGVPEPHEGQGWVAQCIQLTVPGYTVGVLEDEACEIPRTSKEGALRPQEAGPPPQGLGS